MVELVEALKGALTYTRRYRDQTFVVKMGGGILGDERTLGNIAMQVALLESLSIRVVLIHGGGPQASSLSRRLGIEPEIIAGRRVTSGDVLEVAKMVYAGQLNVDLLAALMEAPGRVFSRSDLLLKLQGTTFEGVERTIDVHVRNLRTKIEPDPANPRYIETVFGVGYRFSESTSQRNNESQNR